MSNNTDLHFGEIIKNVLDKTRLTNKELAEHFGFTDVNLYRVYQKKDLNTEIIRKTADIAEIDLVSIFDSSNKAINIKSNKITGSNIAGQSFGSNSTINNNSESFEITKLEVHNEELRARVKELETEVAHKQELMKVKDDLIALYKASGK